MFLVTTAPILHPADYAVIADAGRVLNADDVAKLAAEGIDNFSAQVCLTWSAALSLLEELTRVPASQAFSRAGLNPVNVVDSAPDNAPDNVSTDADLQAWLDAQQVEAESERRERERRVRAAMKPFSEMKSDFKAALARR